MRRGARVLLVFELAFEVFYSHPEFVLVVPDRVDLGVQASVLLVVRLEDFRPCLGVV
ncbi:hypothetical protein GS891_12265 [Rhodococcus hoagii]|nr:hypothetical protein [Prescottella equi]